MRIISVFFLLFSMNALAKEASAPKAEFVGLGEIKSSPDFIEVNFNVQSECYESPQEAQRATDEVVKRVDAYLNSLKKDGDEHFKILVNGGYTSSFSRWHKDRELCRNTFQKSTDISLRLGAEDNFDKIFSDLQSYTLKNFEHPFVSDFIDSPRTFVRINNPLPQLTQEHRLNLEHEALNLALVDAKARFRATLKSCTSHPWKVLEIKEDDGGEGYVAPRSFHYAAKAAGFAAESSPAPVRFDDLKVEKRLRVSFSFEGALCYEP